MTARFDRGSHLGAQSGQASLLVLGVVAAAGRGLVVLFAFGQALGARGSISGRRTWRRCRRRGDARPLPAAVRAAAARARAAESAPSVLAAYLARARAAARAAARRTACGCGAADVSFPGGSFAPTRVTVVARGVGARCGSARSGARAVPVRASATAELAPAPTRLGCPARGERRRLRRPARVPDGQGDAPGRGARRSTAWPPRPRRAACTCRSRAPSAPTPSRRGCSRPTRTRSGSRRRARASTATPPSSTSARPPPTPGWPPTRAPSASSTATPGSPGTTASAPTRATASTRRSTSAARGSRRAATTAGSHGLPSFVPAALPRPARAGGAALERAGGAARRAALRGVRLQPVRGEPGRGAGDRPVHAGHGARRYGLGDPYDPVAAIDAQAHLMSDLLRRFGGRVALALAAYNAGAGRCRALRRRAAVRRDPRLRGAASSACWAAPACSRGAAFEVRLVE